MQNNDTNVQKTSNQVLTISPVISKNVFEIVYGHFSNSEDFLSLLSKLYKSGTQDELKLRIVSPGGEVTQCQQMVNISNSRFQGRTTAYVESHASSAGAILLAHADKRVVYPNSRVMFHNYSGGIFGTYKKMKDRMNFDEKHILSFLSISKQFFTKKEYKKLVDGKDYWMEAEECLTRGVATHININGTEYSGKKAIKKLKKYNKRNYLKSAK